jgi:glutathione S-transferase
MNKNITPVRGASPITLYVGIDSYIGLVLRYLMSTKNVVMYDIVDVDLSKPNDELRDLSTIDGLPILTDRTQVYQGVDVIAHYLDEAPSHGQPLMFVGDYRRKAADRMAIYRISNLWADALINIENGFEPNKNEEFLLEQFRESKNLFPEGGYFLGSHKSIVDIYLVPLFYKLDVAGFNWKRAPQELVKYAKRMFKEELFRLSLSNNEKLVLRYDLI